VTSSRSFPDLCGSRDRMADRLPGHVTRCSFF
jgi:hypothetical protein